MPTAEPDIESLKLNDDQLASFERDGFVVLRDRFGTDEVAEINEILLPCSSGL